MTLAIPVIIVNWNGIDDTIECLDSLFQMSNKNFEVYLIDNGSDPEEAQQLKEKYEGQQKINLQFNDANIGFTKAYNEAMSSLLKNGDYKYFALLNNDTVVDQQWLDNLIQSAEAHNADMVSSRMINYYNRDLLDNAGHFMLNTGEIMPLGYNEPVDTYDTMRNNVGACAGGCLYSTRMIEKIGLFDEYFHTGYEDAEYGLRALITGHKLILEPKALVYHKMSVSINKIRDLDYMVMVQRSIFYTYLKLIPFPIILLNFLFIVFRTVVVLLLFLVFLRFRYLKIYFKAFYHLFFTDLPVILDKRRSFYKNHDTISLGKVMGYQEFFLLDNIRRFFRYFIRGERTIFEK